MKPYYISLIGLVIDIIGVFFLSIEAIKLENFKKIRDSIFDLFSDSIGFKSQKYTIVYAKGFIEYVKRGRKGSYLIKKEEANSFLKVFYNFYNTHYFGGAFLTFLLIIVIQFFFFDLFKLIGSNYFYLFLIILEIIIAILIHRIFSNFFAYKFSATDIPIKALSIITLLTPPSIIFMIVGELFHIFLFFIDKIVLAILNFIYKNTPNGTTGILGFLLVTIGFVLQFYSIWKSN